MLLTSIRTSKVAKAIALVLVAELMAQFVSPIQAFALTTGPAQPETLSFEPVGTSEMVNVFSGDFTYNIPLLDVGGYPINLSYNSGITTDQEASWVGLGWNINPGAVNRSMRGVPDDFNGDKVTKRFNMKPNRTYGAGFTVGGEFFGSDIIGFSYGVTANYNNYKGVGYEQSLNMAFNSGKGASGPLSGGLGVTSGNDGLDVRPSLSFSHEINKKDKPDYTGKATIGLSMNSRSGLKQLSLNASFSEKNNGGLTGKKNDDGTDGVHSSTRAANGGSSISFASPAYTPQVSMPMINTSLALSIKTGAHVFGADGTYDISGYYSEQRLERSVIESNAFGYLNAENGMSNDYALMDFNREKDGAFTENTPALPLTNFTYDVYSVNGQGIGGMYRPYRSDLGYVYDARNGTYSVSGNLGFEATTGNLAHGGVDVAITDVNTISGRWTQDNGAASGLRFKGYNPANPLYEPYYFKEAGEKSVDSDLSLYNSVGGDQAIRVRLQHTGGLNVVAHNQYRKNNDPANYNLPSLNYRAARQRRNQAITTLTVAEARKYALQPGFYSTGISAAAKDHHIGEITTLRSDGSRYVFGIPAYNNVQQETSFNVQGRSICNSTGIVLYNTGDNTTSNSLGIDNYFSETETPGYAHSYLLTAVLSPDYVDYDQTEGPSAGDLGSYTKLNYIKTSANFKWRTPIDANTRSANYNEGLRSVTDDDKGSYVYGEKEIWYLNTIETKNYVAVFSLSDREDGLGVTNKDGSVNSAAGSRLKKLDKITLYSKPDYDANGANANPIKVVNFEYSYELCPGVPNKMAGSGTGKLTLTKVYFTYGKSYKAKLSGYKFTYADPDHDGILNPSHNPSYNPKANDRWGNYLPNNAFANCTAAVAANGIMSPAEYPYAEQNTSLANQYASSWNLSRIELPSGGIIDIDYEADDYAYVQDKAATQMFKVVDFKVEPGNPNTPGILSTTTIAPADLSNPVAPPQNYGGSSYYLYFKLENNIPSSTSNIPQKIFKDYLNNKTKDLYFRFFTDITSNGDYEYVSGYFDVDYVDASDIGVGVVTNNMSGSDYQYAWIRLKRVPIGDREEPTSQQVNPICKAAWQFGRMQLPRKVWEQPDPQGNGVEQVVTAMANANLMGNIQEFFKGPNRTIRDKGFGRRAMMNKSWIRLQSPDGIKTGGGVRVKRVSINDNWKAMADPNNANNATLPASLNGKYGQEYTYRAWDEANQRFISSGVASYEPQLGGDENPFRQPVYFSEDRKLVPDEDSYQERPYGESFFPSPGVGYSRVEVKSLVPSNVTRHATGYTVQEFYTAKDFPTITRLSDLEVQHWRTNPILSLLRISMKDYLTASQGFVVELNDMHGKPKAVTVFAQGQTTPISEVKYIYKTDPNDARHLDNTVNVVSKNGTVTTAMAGLDYDFVADMREQQTDMKSGGLNVNAAAFLAGIIPAVVPTILPSWSSEDTRFRSAVITKVINRSGILVRTEARDAGSTAITENLAWDQETGELLLTKTYTNFDDAVYSFNYPAHWTYDRMGQAYKNIAVKLTGVTVSSGNANITNASSYFVKGDEVSVEAGNYWKKAWVCNVNTNSISLIDANGTSIANMSSLVNATIKVIRSGRRNMQAVSVGAVVSRNNPLKDINADGILDLAFEEVLSAGAVEFAEYWSVAPGKTATTSCKCSLTPLAAQIGNMLNTLASNGVITTNGTTLLENGVYSQNYTTDLNALRGNPTRVVWAVTAAGTTLNGTINPTAGGGADCPITLTLPSGYTWSQVIGLTNMVPVSPTCTPTTSAFTMLATVTSSNGPIQVLINGTSTCLPGGFGDCSQGTTCGVQAGNTVNPYFHNILGNWRPLRNQTYLSDRSQSATAATGNVDTRKEGVFVTKDQTTGAVIPFQPFWTPNAGNDWQRNATYWTWAQLITKYTPFGNEVENMDALGRYSSAVFGYNNTLPLLVASNSRHQNVGFDGFEDYSYISSDCRQLHFSFYDAMAVPDATQAHTGLYSAKVSPGGTVAMTRTLMTTLPSQSTANCPFTVAQGDLNGVFAPYTGGGATTYVLNYWVKESTTLGSAVFNYPNAQVSVSINSTPLTLTLVQKSGIVEGWQQYQYTFTIPASQSGSLEVKLTNTSGPADVWFDDIRIHPFDASMVSYVYHPVNQRLISQLDENNYATIYEYDEEGALVRVKKETERGIMTLKEARNNSFHR
ncbi:MAG: hypothetical protein MUC87_22255 [Bacteroidia bacterium]|jgi:hypothetical protein|nr:hypothetical protein [Bacteroidia bacterium]